MAGAKDPSESDTIGSAGHLDISDENIKFMLSFDHLDRFVAGLGFAHIITGISQRLGQDQANEEFIFNQQDARRGQMILQPCLPERRLAYLPITLNSYQRCLSDRANGPTLHNNPRRSPEQAIE